MYETLGDLFRAQKEMLGKTLSERIEMLFMKILRELLALLPIDVEQTLYWLASSEKSNIGVLVLLNVVNQFDDSFVKSRKGS